MPKQYPDLRFKYIRGLIRHERDQRRQHYLKQAAEWTSKAIVSLSLTDAPIRSIKQAQKLEGIGGVTGRVIKENIDNNETIKEDPPCISKYISSAAALLVSMLNAQEILQKERGKDNVLVPEEMLRELVSPICEEYFVDNRGRSQPVFCMAWWRLNVLCSRGYIKKRSQNKLPVYELLEAGFHIAHRLRGTRPDVHSPKHDTQTDSNIQPHNTHAKCLENGASDALYSNDDGLDGILLLVDIHEQGGERCRLGELSRCLTQTGVRHKTQHLRCGDYCWVWRRGRQEKILPVLVERKRADDMAWSLKDGRYFRQKQQMLEWKNEYTKGNLEVALKYVIESTPEAYRVTCGDECGGVARCGNPSVMQVKNVIRELEESGDFDVIRTPDIHGTVEFLVTVTLELQHRLDSGDFDNIFSTQVPTSEDICKEAPQACQICSNNNVKKPPQQISNSRGRGIQRLSLSGDRWNVAEDTDCDLVSNTCRRDDIHVETGKSTPRILPLQKADMDNMECPTADIKLSTLGGSHSAVKKSDTGILHISSLGGVLGCPGNVARSSMTGSSKIPAKRSIYSRSSSSNLKDIQINPFLDVNDHRNVGSSRIQTLSNIRCTFNPACGRSKVSGRLSSGNMKSYAEAVNPSVEDSQQSMTTSKYSDDVSNNRSAYAQTLDENQHIMSSSGKAVTSTHTRHVGHFESGHRAVHALDNSQSKFGSPEMFPSMDKANVLNLSSLNVMTRKRHSFIPMPTFESDSEEECRVSSKETSKKAKTSNEKENLLEEATPSFCSSKYCETSKNTFNFNAVILHKENSLVTDSSDEDLLDQFSSTHHLKLQTTDMTQLPSLSRNKQESKMILDEDDEDCTSDKISTMLAVLPDISRIEARTKLKLYNGNIDAAMESLLESSQRENFNLNIPDEPDLPSSGVIDLTDSQ